MGSRCNAAHLQSEYRKRGLSCCPNDPEPGGSRRLTWRCELQTTAFQSLKHEKKVPSTMESPTYPETPGFANAGSLVYVPIDLPIHRYTYLSTYLPIYLSLYLSIYLRLSIYIYIWGMGQYPVLSRGPTPPAVTNPCRAGFVTNLCRAAMPHDGPCRASIVAKKTIFVTNFVAQGAPRPCYKPEGFDPHPYIYIYATPPHVSTVCLCWHHVGATLCLLLVFN